LASMCKQPNTPPTSAPQPVPAPPLAGPKAPASPTEPRSSAVERDQKL
jgi:hypothetical protein